MNENDLMWQACLDAPADDVGRGAFADKLQEAGFEGMAEMMRGRLGRVCVHVAAGQPLADRPMVLLFMTEGERDDELDSHVNAEIDEIFQHGLAADTMADTNAAGWTVDEAQIQDVRYDATGCHVHFTFRASGDQNTDAVYTGDSMSGDGVATIDPAGVVTHEVTRAEIDDYSDDGDPEDETGA